MDIDKLVKLINEGNIAVVPTDTVYGIVGDALNIDVIHKVYEVKKRDYSKPLILMVSSIDMLKRYVDEINDIDKYLINKYWPGKLTSLFKKNNKINVYSRQGHIVGKMPFNFEGQLERGAI